MKKKILLLLCLLSRCSNTNSTGHDALYNLLSIVETLVATIEAKIQEMIVPESTIPEKHMVIVTAGYNSYAWYKKNLDSIFSQDYTNYELVYVDDGSDDDTFKAVCDYIADLKVDNQITLIRNNPRLGSSLENHYNAILKCKDTDIIISLDADDWFAHDKVLQRVNEAYADGTTWLTYGQFQEYPSGTHGWCQAIPNDALKNNTVRSVQRMPSHLKTFYAGLFKKIAYEDLLDEDGGFYKMTPDMVKMLPMVEMARNGHTRFIPEILYIYNGVNPLSEHRVSKEGQLRVDRIIRSKKPYDALETLWS